MPPAEGRPRLLAYLADLEARQAARKQFGRVRLDGRPLLDWLRRHLEGSSAIWGELDATDPARVAGVGAGRTPELAYEYNLRLIDAVLARAAKERRED
jgi:hypothetical protein